MDVVKGLVMALLLSLSCQMAAAEAININTADKETLMAIKGVGDKRADAIIEYRELNGPFEAVDDLAAVSGVGQAIVDKNRDSLTIGE